MDSVKQNPELLIAVITELKLTPMAASQDHLRLTRRLAEVGSETLRA
jgi:hypothetical protein